MTLKEYKTLHRLTFQQLAIMFNCHIESVKKWVKTNNKPSWFYLDRIEKKTKGEVKETDFNERIK